MSISIPLSPEAEAKLREKAAAVGEDITAYAAGVLERSAKQPVSLEEISGPIAEQFQQSGMTEDELSQFLEDAKHEMRRQRRAS